MSKQLVNNLGLIASIGFLAGMAGSLIFIFDSDCSHLPTIMTISLTFLTGTIALLTKYYGEKSQVVKADNFIVTDSDLRKDDLKSDSTSNNFTAVNSKIDSLINSGDAKEKKLDSFIRLLCTEFQAGQGLVYLKEENEGETSLRLIASYAYTQHVSGDGINVWDGMVGLSIKENRKIELDGITNENIKIFSGLGKSAPKSILIVPVVEGENSKGAVELAFFKTISPQEKNTIENNVAKLATII